MVSGYLSPPARIQIFMVKKRDVVRAWGAVLLGRKPALSIEITKECPLRCPGCYAFAAEHVAPGVGLKQLHDLRGDALVDGVIALVRRRRPLHLSIVGGDPLVRYRELEVLVPRLLAMGVFLQIVTSAFRPLPAAWAALPNLELVVSIDGLAPDHDRRRAPATYERILRNIAGHQVVVHCTITAQMARANDYLESFIQQWSANPNVKKIWMSIFTPQ
ncbi:MAG: radical SAM protein, partial [Terriglobales bacterium]